MSKAMIIINPSSGKEKAGKILPKAEKALGEIYDEVSVCKTEGEGDATNFAKEACAERFDAVISMGGDGTVNEIVNGLGEQQHRPIFGIIPLGTINDFARSLRIPLDPNAAIEILKDMHMKESDIGKINDRYFMNVLAVGAIAEATYNVTVEQKTRLGSFAYFIEGAKAIIKKTPFPLTVEHDQGKWIGEAHLLIATMTNSVGGFEQLAPEAEVNDGKLHTFIIKDLSLPLIVKIIPSLIRGEIKGHDEVEYIKTSKLHLATSEELAVNIDGDEGILLPFQANVLHKHLRLFVPGTK
ncbi:diacylglycerol kinase family lipid kinase [Bacillus sp. ISL-4]|uniref:diacylglycerol/lipid kinase family protein n=1 Tax=Bacillus sp. ISL-4 TaxID=2819125 RepID=UPI001BE558DB|nr:diacylglycerol kinase family protein [Bacillus sp. ISL-4]MBT2664478.1 diacylglycerol kinase family lipid kinase [Bacillus sp. ISL-4]MBT2673810.1 diacylglycerol kinase family lipid kinase [Streptomyces sp. ISL-14]